MASATAERESLARRYDECRARCDHHVSIAEEAARGAERYSRTIREFGEILGIEDQLSGIDLSDDLRGERLHEIAPEVIWRQFREASSSITSGGSTSLSPTDTGGKNPTATFLT